MKLDSVSHRTEIRSLGWQTIFFIPVTAMDMTRDGHLDMYSNKMKFHSN